MIAGLAAGARAEHLSVGDSFPEVTLLNWDGAPVEIRDDTEQIAVIEFWASWCAPCRSILPEVAALASEHSEGVHVYAVNIDRDRGKADDFLRQHLPVIPRSMILLRDPGGELLARFGAQGMPAIYCAQEGVVRLVEAGAQDDLVERLRELIEEATTAR